MSDFFVHSDKLIKEKSIGDQRADESDEALGRKRRKDSESSLAESNSVVDEKEYPHILKKTIILNDNNGDDQHSSVEKGKIYNVLIQTQVTQVR